MSPEITGADLEYYITQARLRFEKTIVEPEEYEELAVEKAECGYNLAAAVYYSLAMVRFLPDTTKAQEMAQLAADLLGRLPRDLPYSQRME